VTKDYIDQIFETIERKHREQRIAEKIEFLRDNLTTEEFNWLWDWCLANMADSEQDQRDHYESHPRDLASQEYFVSRILDILEMAEEQLDDWDNRFGKPEVVKSTIDALRHGKRKVQFT
jgi:hypothetical protein